MTQACYRQRLPQFSGVYNRENRLKGILKKRLHVFICVKYSKKGKATRHLYLFVPPLRAVWPDGLRHLLH